MENIEKEKDLKGEESQKVLESSQEESQNFLESLQVESQKVIDEEELILKFEKLCITEKVVNENVTEECKSQNLFVEVAAELPADNGFNTTKDKSQEDPYLEFTYDKLSQDSCDTWSQNSCHSYCNCSCHYTSDEFSYYSDCDSNDSWF
jgi:hypothetical protein